MFAWVPFLPGDVGSDVHAQDVVRTSHTYATEFKRRKWAVDRLHISQENRQSFTFAANDADHITTAEWSDNEDEKKIGDSLDHIDVHSNLVKAHGVNGNLVALWGEKLGKTTLKVEFQRRVSDLPEPPKKGDSGELDFHSILAHRNKTKLHVELEAVDFGVGAPLVPPTPPTPTPPTPEAPEEKNGDDAAKKTETPPAESAPAAASETAATAEADAKPEAKAEEGKGEEKAAEEKKGGETPAEASKPNDSKPAEPEKKPEPKQRFATLRGKVLVAPGMEHEHWYAKASPLVHILNGKEKFETGFKKDTEQNKNEWNQEFTLKIEVAEQDGTLVAVHPLHFEIRDHSSFWKNTVLAEAELSIADLKHEEKVERELLLINEDITAFVTGNKELATHHLVHAHYVHNYLASLGWAGSFRYSYGTIDITDGKIPTGSFAFQLDIPLAATEYSEVEKPAGLAGNVQDWLSSFVSNAHHLAVVLTEGLASAESQNTTGSSGTVSFDERLAFGGKDVRLQLIVGLEDLVNASKAADARAKAAAEKAAAEKAAAEKAAAEKAEKEAAEKAAKAAADKAAAEAAAAAAHPEPEKAKEKAGEPTEPVAAKEGEKAAEAEAPPAVEKA